jgi:hypothetical protein
MLRNRRHVVRVRQPLGLVREERAELDLNASMLRAISEI